MYLCPYIDAHMTIYVCLHTCTHICMYSYICIFACMFIMCVYMAINIYTCLPKYIYAEMHTYIPTYVRGWTVYTKYRSYFWVLSWYLVGKPLHHLISMMSCMMLLMTSWLAPKPIKDRALSSMIYNTARFQRVYINLLADCTLILR